MVISAGFSVLSAGFAVLSAGFTVLSGVQSGKTKISRFAPRLEAEFSASVGMPPPFKVQSGKTAEKLTVIFIAGEVRV